MNIELENLNVEKQVEFITLNILTNTVEKNLETVVKNVISDGEYYDGEYDVIPSADNITTLETIEKIMRNNVVVEKIPDYRVDNEFGQTVTIGKEI